MLLRDVDERAVVAASVSSDGLLSSTNIACISYELGPGTVPKQPVDCHGRRSPSDHLEVAADLTEDHVGRGILLTICARYWHLF